MKSSWSELSFKVKIVKSLEFVALILLTVQLMVRASAGKI